VLRWSPCLGPDPTDGSDVHVIRGVLFDLDGTLLDLDLDVFLRRYFIALGAVAAAHFPDTDLLPPILTATGAMQGPHPGVTNREVFFADFEERTGIDLEAAWSVFDDFYRDVFPSLGEGYGPAAGAVEAVEVARALGLRMAIATQPIFPRAAIEHRLAWAGLSHTDFDAVTTYEVMTACKPLAEYFRQTAEMIGCDPRECLMVGDDRSLDMPAGDVGMRTFYVGNSPGTHADFHGTLGDLPDVLARLAGGGVDLE
jgi:FMN phosphatase YigB (HAD superfamily)